MIAFRYLAWVLLVSAGTLGVGCDNNPAPVGKGSGANHAPLADRTPEKVNSFTDAVTSVPKPAVTVSKSELTVNGQSLVTVTPNAASTLHQIIKDKGVTGTWHLRLQVIPGGCCGFRHKLDLDSGAPSASDYTFESGGIKVVILKRQVEMLRGSQVDYGREHEEDGFLIKSPNFEGESLKKWLPVLAAEKRIE